MWLIAIETSGRVGSVAVARDGGLVKEHEFQPGPRHGRDILPAITALLDQLCVQRDQVGAVCVSRGPGSFTGLRIGAACAKTLSWSLGWALVGVPTMDVIAQNAGERDGHVCPVIDARRKYVYAGVYSRKGDLWQPEADILVGPPETVAAELPEGAYVFGDGVKTYPQVFKPERFEIGPEALITGKARHVARLGFARYQDGQRDDPLRMVPLYYRMTEAEENLQSKTS